MKKIASIRYTSNYWMVFWLVCSVISAVLIGISQSINYSAISGLLIGLWMLSLNDILIEKISRQYKILIQQAFRASLFFVVGLNILDFMGLI
ncbi:MAG: hypothetical protein HRU06_06235 [Oceanospirillaceae bacterium]|nr:hypothetical protein [Oceanospirillaceae bacterium]